MELKFKQYLTEGGNAIKNVSRINQENAMATVDSLYKDLFKFFKISKKDVGVLGSTGKKKKGGSSGDIDVALNINAVIANNKLRDIDDVIKMVRDFCTKYTGSNIYDNSGVGIISLGYPVVNKDGKQPKDLVQVDIMFSDNIDYSNWMYYSPAEWESEWKGLYRNTLLSVISHYSRREEEVDGVSKHQLLNYGKGLFDATYSRVGKKGQLNKNAKVIDRKFFTNDPQKLVDALLGPTFKYKDILTFDDIWKAINSSKFLHKKFLPTIKKEFADNLVRRGFTIPPKAQ